MSPTEMLDVRNWLENLVTADGGKITGGGIDEEEPIADFDFVKDGKSFNVSIRFRGAQGAKPPAADHA